ncbi:MAG: LysM peptidoglycan-binding domain-containing protein [Anaerolineae bacterium]
MGKLNGLRSRSLNLLLMVGVMAGLAACNLQQNIPNPNSPAESIQQLQAVTATLLVTATETIPPYTPLPSLTPSVTLRPPPTFEPPTQTPPPTSVPTSTTIPTLALDVSVPGLRGAETPTPSTTPGCVPRKDWKLTYTVQRDDALAKIADKYGTYVQELVNANCLTDPNVIVIGQVLKVPGDVQPVEQIECTPWEVLTPIDNALDISGEGNLTLNWRGPRAPRNLIRIIRPNGSIYERVIELRQNESIDLADIPEGGNYQWYVYPLDSNFVQIPCKEGGPWRFTKATKPPTATPNALLGP